MATAVTLAAPPPRWVLRTMNRVVRPMLASRLGRRIGGLMLLEFQGRHSGRTIRVPVNRHLVDGTVMAFTDSRWRDNFRGGAAATLTYKGERRDVRGTLVDVSPGEMGRIVRKSLDSGGSAQRLGIRAAKGHDVSADELAAIGPALGTAVIRFEPGA